MNIKNYFVLFILFNYFSLCVPYFYLVLWTDVYVVGNSGFCKSSRNDEMSLTFKAGSGEIFEYAERNERYLTSWVMDDLNGDGWREVCYSIAGYVKCLDVNPANGGPKIYWGNHMFHHEVYGQDAGIDIDGDNINEILVFEGIDYYHYLLNGSNGVGIEGSGDEHRRSQLYWPFSYYGKPKCGAGLSTNVDGLGSNDYVIIGTKIFDDPIPVLQCLEGTNGTILWEKELASTPLGVEIIQVNSSPHILCHLSENISVYMTNGTSLWNLTVSTNNVAVIPNGTAEGTDAIVFSETGTRCINASDSTDLWSISTNLGAVFYSGNLDSKSRGEFGGFWTDSSQTKIGIFNGSDGSWIRNHTYVRSQHGVTYVGDVDNDGNDDYGVHGRAHYFYSGINGTILLEMSGFTTEYMAIQADINENGYDDIIMGNWDFILAVDGSTMGTLNLNPQPSDDSSSSNEILLTFLTTSSSTLITILTVVSAISIAGFCILLYKYNKSKKNKSK
ncbi:MAG: hypothetical protein ACTSO9_13100 [Candidatus Helarchaeota archaeon]